MTSHYFGRFESYDLTSSKSCNTHTCTCTCTSIVQNHKNRTYIMCRWPFVEMLFSSPCPNCVHMYIITGEQSKHVMSMQGCAQDDLSGGYHLAKMEQNCFKCSISALFMLRWWCRISLSVVVKSGRGRPPPTSVGISLSMVHTHTRYRLEWTL